MDAEHRQIARHHLTLACALALTVLAALVIAGRGYRDFWVSYDILPDYENASNFVEKGSIPVKGCLSSLGTYNPPGFSWLYVPGAWLFPREPGLAQALGSAILFGGAVIGLGRLLGTSFGVATTTATVAMFAFSNIGMFYASSLWPRAHVFFYIWTVYYLKRWALDGRPNACAAALATYLLGLYCFFEIAPLGLLFPVVFVIYRPPIARLPILACVLVMLVVWSPYLAYEVTRSGLDVRSFVTGASELSPNEMVDSAAHLSIGARILSAAKSGVMGNHLRGLRPLGGVAVFFAMACGLAFGSSRGRRLIGRYLVATTAHLSIRALRLHQFLGVSLLAPWGLMLLLVLRESSDPNRRFWWLWLLQVYFVAFSVFWILPRLPLRRFIALAAQATMVLAILPWSTFKATISDMRRSGYAGSGERTAAVDSVAATLQPQGRTTARIGYELAVPFWQRSKDGHFTLKVGNDYDLVFRRRHGIDNLDDADVGFAPDDEFRIVELVSNDGYRDLALRSTDLTQFTEIARYGNYWVGRRASAARDR